MATRPHLTTEGLALVQRNPALLRPPCPVFLLSPTTFHSAFHTPDRSPLLSPTHLHLIHPLPLPTLPPPHSSPLPPPPLLISLLAAPTTAALPAATTATTVARLAATGGLPRDLQARPLRRLNVHLMIQSRLAPRSTPLARLPMRPTRLPTRPTRLPMPCLPVLPPTSLLTPPTAPSAPPSAPPNAQPNALAACDHATDLPPSLPYYRDYHAPSRAFTLIKLLLHHSARRRQRIVGDAQT